MIARPERQWSAAFRALPWQSESVQSRLLITIPIGILAGVVACSGNRFSARDDEPEQPSGGSVSQPVAGSSAASDGGEPSGAGGDGDTGGVSGSPPGSGAAPASDGGADGSEGGRDAGGAGDDSGPELPIFTVSKLIDDMEDGNAQLLETNGDWFVIKDGTNGTITPGKDKPFTMTALSPGRGKSTKAAVVSVAGFTGWGAGFGFDFAYGSTGRTPIDLGPALAVRFWAKASKATSVRFQLPNADTDPLGGKCSGEEGDSACNAHWTKPFQLSTEWQETTILLGDLEQELEGRRVPTFDKQHVYSALFILAPNQTVTVWIDDIALVH